MSLLSAASRSAAFHRSFIVKRTVSYGFTSKYSNSRTTRRRPAKSEEEAVLHVENKKLPTTISFHSDSQGQTLASLPTKIPKSTPNLLPQPLLDEDGQRSPNHPVLTFDKTPPDHKQLGDSMSSQFTTPLAFHATHQQVLRRLRHSINTTSPRSTLRRHNGLPVALFAATDDIFSFIDSPTTRRTPSLIILQLSLDALENYAFFEQFVQVLSLYQKQSSMSLQCRLSSPKENLLWIITRLATLLKLEKSNLDNALKSEVHRLWTSWLLTRLDPVYRSFAVPVNLGFMQLSLMLGDSHFVRSITDHIQRCFGGRLKTIPHDHFVLQQRLAELLFNPPKGFNSELDLGPRDPEKSYPFRVPNIDRLAWIIKDLLRRDDVELALHFIDSLPIPHDSQCHLAWIVISSLPGLAQTRLSPQATKVFAKLCQTLISATSLPENPSRAWVWAMCVLIRGQQANAAVGCILDTIARRTQIVFSSTNMKMILNLLGVHRQYGAALTLLRGLPSTFPSLKMLHDHILNLLGLLMPNSPLRRNLVVAFRRSTPVSLQIEQSGPVRKLSKLNTRALCCPKPHVFRLRYFMRQYLSTHSKMDASLGEAFGRSGHIAMRLLIDINRLKAARQFYEYLRDHDSGVIYPTGSPANQKALNILLSKPNQPESWRGQKPPTKKWNGSLSRFNRVAKGAENIQDLAETYKELTNNSKYKMIPNRVTCNILLRSIILMSGPKNVSAEFLRQLFDKLVLDGYPTGLLDTLYRDGITDDQGGFKVPAEIFHTSNSGNGSDRNTVFGNRRSNLTAVRSLMTTEAQVQEGIDLRRHVIPLYKMFIKGFYQRGDVDAARRISKILKQIQNMADLVAIRLGR